MCSACYIAGGRRLGCFHYDSLTSIIREEDIGQVKNQSGVIKLMNQAVLERRSEILKKNIHEMILQDNQNGISHQKSNLLQHMIKELHQTSHEMNARGK
jgi:hypothetical protein